MPLQNRVDAFGELFAHAARGTMMGNRGGKFHRDDKTLGKRRQASKQWICCVLEFKGRQRDVWGRYYTELFFLDEVTALAAGHRPCFECRRTEAEAFRTAVGRSHANKHFTAAELDVFLDVERRLAKEKVLLNIDDLPDGTMLDLGGSAFALKGDQLLRWTPTGYQDRRDRPPGGAVEVLTPPSIVSALVQGYEPRWHESAK